MFSLETRSYFPQWIASLVFCVRYKRSNCLFMIILLFITRYGI